MSNYGKWLYDAARLVGAYYVDAKIGPLLDPLKADNGAAAKTLIDLCSLLLSGFIVVALSDILIGRPRLKVSWVDPVARTVHTGPELTHHHPGNPLVTQIDATFIGRSVLSRVLRWWARRGGARLDISFSHPDALRVNRPERRNSSVTVDSQQELIHMPLSLHADVTPDTWAELGLEEKNAPHDITVKVNHDFCAAGVPAWLVLLLVANETNISAIRLIRRV